MHVEVNGTRLWFDVEGPALVPSSEGMVERPTVVLVHGGPGSYDHSYFKPHFSRLAGRAQLVYLDLRGHGRSEWGDAGEWSFEDCADDVRAFCDALGIVRPVVYGHSMGGFVTMLYGARHPGHATGLILHATMARFDLARLVEGMRRFGDEEVARIAERDYGGEQVTDAEWARVFAVFGPKVPTPEELSRLIQNPAVGEHGMDLLREFDVVSEMANIECPTLVCVGALDAVTSVAASQEILDSLPPGVGQLEVIDGAGHFSWLDAPDRFWTVLESFLAMVGAGPRS